MITNNRGLVWQKYEIESCFVLLMVYCVNHNYLVHTMIKVHCGSSAKPEKERQMEVNLVPFAITTVPLQSLNKPEFGANVALLTATYSYSPWDSSDNISLLSPSL